MLIFNKIFNRTIIKPKIDFLKYENKSILIAGSSGSIGKNILKKLNKYTINITAVDMEFGISKNSNI
jgi:FlaA1/EpsC-like NDP-sugar epimerase